MKQWAQHLVLMFPLWLGDMPALMKAFLEQVARPGLAGPVRAEGAMPPRIFDLRAEALTDAVESYLAPLEAGLDGLPEVVCSATGAARLRNGNPGEVVLAPDVSFGDLAWASHAGQAIAIGRYQGGMLHPDRVFVAPV